MQPKSPVAAKYGSKHEKWGQSGLPVRETFSDLNFLTAPKNST